MGYKIGLDLGVGSVGWAVMRTDEKGNPIRIEDLGSRVFDKAEHPKNGASLAAPRREARGTRRRLRRRRHRRDRVLSLLENYNIISKKEVKEMFDSKDYRKEKNVYELRVEGLDTILTSKELARVLINFVKRRGYKSNSKSDETSNKETGKLLTATVENDKIMKENNYRTVAEMYLKDSRYVMNLSNGYKILKIRNTTDEYKSTVRREDLLNEIKLILNKQHELNSKITSEFIEKYIDIFESQRSFEEGPGGNSIYGGNQIEKMLGKCTFEKGEYRAMKATYSFEYFKLLQDINHIKIEYQKDEAGTIKNVSESLNESQRKEIIELAKKRDTIKYKDIRKVIDIPEYATFNTVRYDYSVSKDLKEVIEQAEDKSNIKEFQSYHKIRKALDKVKKGKINEISKVDLDNIGYALSVYKSDNNKTEYLKNKVKSLNEEEIKALLPLSFSKTSNLSIKAINKIIPYLEEGKTYDKAVNEVYKDFRGNINTKRITRLSLNNLDEEIPNPVVKRAVSQTIKVLNAILKKYGEPDAVNIELARELAKNFEQRRKIDLENQEKRAENDRIKEQIEELNIKTNITGQDIVKYKLWQEQNGVCIYSGHKITLNEVFDESTDVDHIIPYSISFDDSYANKVLVLASENRVKGNRVPLEYFKQENKDDSIFRVRIENTYRQKNKIKKMKKLLTESISREDILGFKERIIKDTQYLSKVVHNLIRNNLKFAENNNFKRKVEVVNGTITSHIRKRLGIEKIRSNGDEHHAIDAVIIACVSPQLIQDISNFYKVKEMKNLKSKGKDKFVDRETGEIIDFNILSQMYEKYFPEPYKGFRKELEIRTLRNEELMHEALKKINYDTYENILNIKPIFVSRMPRRRVTGAAHKDTIKGLRRHDDCYYSVKKTALKDLKYNKEKNEIEGYPEKQKRDDIYLYEGLLNRLKAFDYDPKLAFKEDFYKPNKDGSIGQLVKKVKIESKTTSFVPLNGGKSMADNGGMIRIDVFFVENDGYYFIPIYTADVLKEKLPNKACVPGKEWKIMEDKDFIFSLYPNDLIYIENKKGINLKPLNKDNDELVVNKLFAYYVKAGISTASITIINQDKSYEQPSLGLKSLMLIKKYQVGVLGDIHEVKIPEKRVEFNLKNKKGGKKA